jgi:aspartate aminotransferase
MAAYLDRVPFSGIIRIRDMMYSVANPFRLDQGDVSFDVPDTVKTAMARAIAENKTHYLQTTGVPRLRDLIAAKLRNKNHIAAADADHVLVTNGGIHGLYILCQALLEPGDEVIIPDPEWPPAAGNILAAKGVPVGCPLHEARGWRYDLDELESKVTARTRVLYLNSPHNPTGGILTRSDLERIAAIATEHALVVISDEAYEDIIFEGEHTSIASFPGMYEQTIPLYSFSKSYAMTGLRLGYVSIKDPVVRERARKVLFYTASNIASVVQYGGIGALEGSQDPVEEFRLELRARRDLFYKGIGEIGPTMFTGVPPPGAFYAFLRVATNWHGDSMERAEPSVSWRLTGHLLKNARIGSVPGVDFGAHGEGYIRFCFARERAELLGALDSMKALFSRSSSQEVIDTKRP